MDARMRTASINDRLSIAKNAIKGDYLGKAVVKATKADGLAPKKKHVITVVESTRDGYASMPDLMKMLTARLESSDWVVVFKSLVVIHVALRDGNLRFADYLAGRTTNFNFLYNFHDRSSPQALEMSGYVRRYARYLEERVYSYRALKVDICRTERSSQGAHFRQLADAPLVEEINVLQNLVGALVEIQFDPETLLSGMIVAAFLPLMKDLTKTFVALNEAIISMLERFFEMRKEEARESVAIYKKFVPLTNSVVQFFEMARKATFEEKTELPEIKHAPITLLAALEDHVKAIDTKDRRNSIIMDPAAARIGAPADGQRGSVSRRMSVSTGVGLPPTVAIAGSASPARPPHAQPQQQQPAPHHAQPAPNHAQPAANYAQPARNHTQPAPVRAAPATNGAAKRPTVDDLLSLENETNLTRAAEKLTLDAFDPYKEASTRVKFAPPSAPLPADVARVTAMPAIPGMPAPAPTPTPVAYGANPFAQPAYAWTAPPPATLVNPFLEAAPPAPAPAPNPFLTTTASNPFL